MSSGRRKATEAQQDNEVIHMFNHIFGSPVTSFNINRLNQTAIGLGNFGDVSNTAVVLTSSSARLHG